MHGAPASRAQLGFPLVESFTATETGITGTAWTIREDQKGVLHIGFDSLGTYDGARWRPYPIASSFCLRGLDFASDDRLWAAAVDEMGWFSRTPNGWVFHSLKDQLPAAHSVGSAWHAFAEGDGAVFLTENNILRWDGTRFTIWSLADGRRLRGFRINGQIYVHHEVTGLHVMGAAGPELVLPASIMGSRALYWIERNGNEWAYLTSEGLFRVHDGQAIPVGGAAEEFIRQNGPTTVVELPDGQLAVGTMRGGLALVTREGSVTTTWAEPAGLNAYVVPLVCDRRGDLWLASRATLFRVSLSANTTLFDARAGLRTDPVEDMISLGEGVVIANSEGLFRYVAAKNAFEPFAPAVRGVWALHARPDGVISAGYRGASYVRGDHATTLHKTGGDVFAITGSNNDPDRYFISDGREVRELTASGQSRVIVANLPATAMSIVEDVGGRLWLGTRTHGLLVVDGAGRNTETAERWGIPAFDGPARVAPIPGGGVIAFSSAGAWVRRGDSGKFEAVRDYPSRGVPVAAKSLDEGKTIWVAHPAESGRGATVACIILDATGAQWRPHAIDGLSSIGSPRSILAQKTADAGTVLWVGGTTGLLRHELGDAPVAPAPAAPLLRAFARNKKTDTRDIIVAPLPFSTPLVEFEFATLESTRHRPLHLETRIDEIDSNWLPAGLDSRRELTALRDGRYTFRVRAVADTGMASAPSVFAFEVLPPWWRTSPAIVCGLLALLPLGYGGYWLWVRTLRKRNAELEEKVRIRTDELARASAAKTQFVANMSHDIRNPLNGIVGLALALEDTRLDSRQQEIVATLRECTTYLSSLVDDVLDFASIEAGRVELRPGPFVPQELLRSIVETLKADTAESGARLTIETAPDLPRHIVGDAGRIQQILVNFVSNALKYAGGHIRLVAAVPADSAGEIEFSVRDDGAGIAEAEQAVLFTKFSRLKHAHGGEPIPGRGLGLAACRLLADLMGGSVGVESRPGEGARFFLRLPLTIADAPVERAPTTLPNTTVLLVEDTDYNAWAATAVLAKLGLSCERARTGAEALQLFAAKRFNVVLLDRNLPDMDGTEVAQRMRALESDGLQSILLAVTAYCTAEDRALCLKSGMDAFVGKPLTPEKLRKVLLAAGRRLLATPSLHAVPEPSVKELDLSLLTYLSNGTSEGLSIQIERFVTTLEDAHVELHAAMAARDLEKSANIAHRLLGQAKMVRANRLISVTETLQAAARSKNRQAAEAALDDVRRQVQNVTVAMRRPRSAVPSA